MRDRGWLARLSTAESALLQWICDMRGRVEGTRGKPRAMHGGGKPPQSKMGSTALDCAGSTLTLRQTVGCAVGRLAFPGAILRRASRFRLQLTQRRKSNRAQARLPMLPRPRRRALRLALCGRI